MHGILLDLRYVLRGLTRTPGLFLIATITIALGVGANTAMFSIVNAVLLKPLPYPEGQELVSMWPEKRWSLNMMNDVRERVQSYDGITAHNTGVLTLFGESEPQPLEASSVTSNHFDVLGVQPMMGRGFEDADAIGGNGPVAILSYGLWQRAFGADPGVIGRNVELAGMGAERRTIIGVMPPGYTGLVPDAQVWLPVITGTDVPGYNPAYGYSVTGRLSQGIAAPRASSELRGLVEEMTPLHPTQFRQIRYSPVDVVPLLDQIVSNVRSQLFVLLGVVGFILLIACSNVANLLLARSTARQRDVALQMALGSSRARVIRQVLAESTVLGLIGGLTGVAAAFLALPLIRGYVQDQLPRTGDISLDLRVLGFGVLVSLAAGLLFGALPAARAVRQAPTGMLREVSRSHSPGRRSGRVNDTLVVAEVALSLMLLAGAGLMLKSLWRLSNVDPGFRSENVLTMQLMLPPGNYATPEQRQGFAVQALARVQGMPGVASAGLINTVPLTLGSTGIPYSIEGEPTPAGADYQVVNFRVVTPDYFDVLRIPLVQGRQLEAVEPTDGEATLLVNAAFVRQHWPGGDPIGKRLLGGTGNPIGTIAGVVGDIRQMEISAAAVPEVYMHNSQAGWPLGQFLVRGTSGVPSASTVSAALREVEPRLTIRNVRPMDEIMRDALGDTRFFARLFTGFGLLAVTLALIGVYGVMSFAISQRFREMGVRMALGATRSIVMRGVLIRAMGPVLIGVTLGVTGALVGGRLMAMLLFEVSTTDPLVLAAVALLMATIGFAGALIPAVRVIRLNPLRALRSE